MGRRPEVFVRQVSMAEGQRLQRIHRSHADQDAAIGDYIRWHNQHAKPKSTFATNSKIRHPDHAFKAA